MDIITEISKRGRRFKLRKSKLISLVYRGASSLESFLSLSPSLNLLPLEPPRDLRSVDELPRLHSRRKISPTPSGTTWFVCLSSSKSVKGNSVFPKISIDIYYLVRHVQFRLVFLPVLYKKTKYAFITCRVWTLDYVISFGQDVVWIWNRIRFPF